jgi:hypothetical protein
MGIFPDCPRRGSFSGVFRDVNLPLDPHKPLIDKKKTLICAQNENFEFGRIGGCIAWYPVQDNTRSKRDVKNVCRQILVVFSY